MKIRETVHENEQVFKVLIDQVAEIEEKFRSRHPVRDQLTKIRHSLSEAAVMNREDKGTPQAKAVYVCEEVL